MEYRMVFTYRRMESQLNLHIKKVNEYFICTDATYFTFSTT